MKRSMSAVSLIRHSLSQYSAVTEAGPAVITRIREDDGDGRAMFDWEIETSFYGQHTQLSYGHDTLDEATAALQLLADSYIATQPIKTPIVAAQNLDIPVGN